MNENLEKFLKLKTPVKIGATIGAAVLMGVVYQFLFYTDLADQIAQVKGGQDALKEERNSYERRKTEYLAYRNELTQLQEKQRELLRALPRAQEIPSFIGSIQEQAELAGLEIVKLAIDAEVPEELYIKIPVRMEIRGSFHNVTRFFKNISELRRIVNVEDLSLRPEPPAANAPPDAPVRQYAVFTAATFRYNDPAAAAGGATP